MLRTFILSVAIAMCACSKAPAASASPAPQTTGAGKAAPGQTAAPAAPAPQPPKPVPAQLPDVVARVNGEAMTKAEFERAVAAIEGRAGGPVPAEQRDQVFRDVLDQVVGFKLLVQETNARKARCDRRGSRVRASTRFRPVPERGRRSSRRSRRAT